MQTCGLGALEKITPGIPGIELTTLSKQGVSGPASDTIPNKNGGSGCWMMYLANGKKIQTCIRPHSPWATTATLLLDSSVAIESVHDLLDHKHITTTQILISGGAPCATPPPTRCRFEKFDCVGRPRFECSQT